MRPQSRGEEIAPTASATVWGFLASLVGAPFFIVATVREGSTWNVVGACVFVASMLLLYLSSTLYHALPQERVKRVFLGLRSRLHLSSHRRHLHAVHVGRPARRLWLDALRPLVLGMAILGITLQGVGSPAAADLVHRPLSRDGLVDRHRGASPVAARATPRPSLVGGRRSLLHRGRRFLRGQTNC